MVNLMDYLDDKVFPTKLSRKLTLNGRTDPYYVYRIKLDMLYYNDKNDRIATWIKQYEAEKGPLPVDNREEYNDLIQGFIEKSNPEAMDQTLGNIRTFGQKEAGVVLQDRQQEMLGGDVLVLELRADLLCRHENALQVTGYVPVYLAVTLWQVVQIIGKI